MSKIQQLEPKTIEQYQIWLKLRDKDFDHDTAEKRYEALTQEIKTAIETSELWTGYILMIQQLNSETLTEFGYPLLTVAGVNLEVKSWDSFYLKSYRTIVWNVLR
jgi:hypothetical protein